MDKMHEIAGDVAQMPRFGDGMADMAELIRVTAESLVNEIMDAQADGARGSGNRRNGCRGRRLATGVGTIDPRVPKPRAGSCFPGDLIGRCPRVDRAVVATVSETVADGAPTRRVKRAARPVGMDRMDAGRVPGMRSSLDESVADLQERDLSEASHPYIRPDAACVKRGDAGRVQPAAPATAIGAGSDGYRRLLGPGAGDAESHGGRESFLPSLRARGVDGVTCATGDAHGGLKRAIQEVFPGAAWQRCAVHPMRSAAGNAPTRQKRGAVPGILKAVFAERDPELVRVLHRLATEQIEGFCPKAAEVPGEAEADAPAYPGFPCEHRVGPHTDDAQGRADRGPRRRGRVVQAFPSRKSPIGTMGAAFSETDEGRAGRRRLGDGSIGRAVEGAEANAPAPACGGTAAEHAARIIALVVADDPVPGRKAA